jgi:monoamine oxidase
VSARKYDVLIIGGGASGLAAGRTLAEAGRRVAILEARNRVGGRIFTHQIVAADDAAPIPVELGAEFIHGLPRATWALADEAGLKAYEIEGSHLWFARGQLMPHSEQEDNSYRVLEGMAAWLATQPPGADLTFAEFLGRIPVDASTAESVASYVEGFNAADRNRIGIAALAKQQRAEDAIESGRLFRFERGYEVLPNFVAEEFVRAGGTLILGKPVQRVAWRRGAVDVTVRDAAGRSFQLHADRAVISVPLGVLQAESIEFDPLPAEILTQARRLVMGAVVHATLIFHDRLWSKLGSTRPGIARELEQLSFLFSPSELPATWWTSMPRDIPILTAWAAGPKAEALQRLTAASGGRQALLDQILTTLGKIFDFPRSDLEKLLLSWHTHDWQADAYARGAYSYVPAGALDAPERMTRPVENTLFFAGEHTDTSGHWGTVHAALATGAVAARQVLEAD